MTNRSLLTCQGLLTATGCLECALRESLRMRQGPEERKDQLMMSVMDTGRGMLDLSVCEIFIGDNCASEELELLRSLSSTDK